MSTKTTPIQRVVFGKQTFPKVIDITFRELTPIVFDTSRFETIEYFFKLYDDLFYQITPTGPSNSHELLVTRSSDYIGIQARSSDLDALIEEINDLRRQNLQLNQQIIDLTTKV